MNDYQMTVLQPVCPDCGADASALVHPVPLDWRDEQEAHLGANARAVQEHRSTVHPVAPKLGDVVVYFAAWRGLIIGNGPLRVDSIQEGDLHEYARSLGADMPVLMGTSYRLVNPSRESDYYLPSAGWPDSPISFEILTEYTAPPVEASLFDLLGGEWAEVAA